jgi:hypothetical protein
MDFLEQVLKDVKSKNDSANVKLAEELETAK